MLWAMTLGLWRDRAAFALTFLLPVFIYTIFAAVFASAAGGDFSVRIALYVDADPVAEAIALGLQQSPQLTGVTRVESVESLADEVRAGRVAAGLAILRPDQTKAPQFEIFAEATREAPAVVLESALARLAPDAPTGEAARRIFVNPVNVHAPMAAYYAAGVAMLFLILSGFQTALALHEERDAGVIERIAASPSGIHPLIDARFIFIAVQGVAQIGVILAAAAIIFSVDLGHAPLALALASIGAATGAAGLTLAVTTLCRSRAQAHAVGTVIALILAAIGGSMAPKFLMPPQIAAIGDWTPNGLGIDAFGAALWAGGGAAAALTPAGLLAAMGIGMLLVAHIAAGRALSANA